MDIYELGQRSNINVRHFREKSIIIYDDHRYLLNVLFALRDQNAQVPNLVFFDMHDDALPSMPLADILTCMGIDSVDQMNERALWSFTEFDLSGGDDNWLRTGMELGLINDAIVIGQEENDNILDRHEHYVTSDGRTHQLHDIPHLDTCLCDRSILTDPILVQPWYQEVRSIIGYDMETRFVEDEVQPFVLDFDLDCFTGVIADTYLAWPESIFRKKYVDNWLSNGLLRQLIDTAKFITICREPSCCGGFGESNKILSYLDRYFFEGCLGTRALQ